MSKMAAVVPGFETDSELAQPDYMEPSASPQKCCGDNPDKPCCGRCKDCPCARLLKRDSSEE